MEFRIYRREIIGGKYCYIYENAEANNFIIQAVDEHDLELLDREVELIKELSSGIPFTLIAFLIEDWNSELSPWEAPAVFGKNGFGGRAADTLAYITDTLIPGINDVYKHNDNNIKTNFYLGGYSLSGLFSLWAAYQTDIFCGIAAVSPSVWFPDWDTYMTSHTIQTANVYLSLGEKEEKTKNKVMSQVGDNIRKQYSMLREDNNVKTCILEWNPGNHFVDSEIRIAKGVAWLLKKE